MYYRKADLLNQNEHVLYNRWFSVLIDWTILTESQAAFGFGRRNPGYFESYFRQDLWNKNVINYLITLIMT